MSATNGAERAHSPALPLADRLALGVKEAARAIGISERKMRELLPAMPHLRVGGRVLIPIDELRAWLRRELEAPRERVAEAMRGFEEKLGTRRRE